MSDDLDPWAQAALAASRRQPNHVLTTVRERAFSGEILSPPSAEIMAAAKALAKVHFSRRQHVGACTKEERVSYLVDAHWRNHIPDAEAALRAAQAARKAKSND